MTFTVINDLSQGLYFFQGQRRTVKAEKSFSVYEPRIGKIVAECPIADQNLVNEIVNQAKSAQSEWAKLSPIERSKVLLRAADIIREHLEAVAIWEVKTNGKPINEARCDIESSADTFTFYGGILPAAIKGDYFDLPCGGESNRFAYTRREPYGVVGCIGAWNYPFQTAVWKVAPALAAGNSVVYKPSPFAPASPIILGEILKEAGLPDGVFNVIQGEGETGQYLCLNENVRKVSFTGSVATGQKIQQACAQRGIKPVTLELGGKSAFVVFDDCDLQSAVSAAILANFLNQGEVCTNATRVFVQDTLIVKFTEILLGELAKIRVGDPLEKTTNVGATINEAHLNKVIGMLERALSQGAKVLYGGKRVHPQSVEEGFYFEPAVITNVDDSWEIAQNEIFGAIMLLMPFKDENEVLQRANSTEFGLASGVYTKDLARAHRVASKLEAGTVYVNTYNDTDVHIPFGGVKISGHGRENCIECLHAYTQIKSIYVNISEKPLEHNLN
ncbi:aldehyde dehydrogenase family domain-containing protein [Ditylenchus destructor]|uniref:Aldehyde dehydrogenase family domain-containing protein n=1 Tax=Ditylenchus destructor TaxID=166010 RepID=A0AAD4ND81_9BILA|nr:aldehyde dehydrogenase family domain-containing protein [Ditylenchus destructor]